jgi:hypothetical protein
MGLFKSKHSSVDPLPLAKPKSDEELRIFFVGFDTPAIYGIIKFFARDKRCVAITEDNISFNYRGKHINLRIVVGDVSKRDFQYGVLHCEIFIIGMCLEEENFIKKADSYLDHIDRHRCDVLSTFVVGYSHHSIVDYWQIQRIILCGYFSGLIFDGFPKEIVHYILSMFDSISSKTLQKIDSFQKSFGHMFWPVSLKDGYQIEKLFESIVGDPRPNRRVNTCISYEIYY